MILGRILVKMLILQTTNMNVYGIDRHAQGFFNLEPNDIHDAGGHRFYPGPVFDDDIQVNIDIAAIIFYGNPVSRILTRTRVRPLTRFLEVSPTTP